MKEVTDRVEQGILGRYESDRYANYLRHMADDSGIINIALSELDFEFKKGVPEAMRIVVNDIRERCDKVQAEFEANFDKGEDKYCLLYTSTPMSGLPCGWSHTGTSCSPWPAGGGWIRSIRGSWVCPHRRHT